MIYIILGMHKSGTTLVSRILHETGINMISAFDPNGSYDEGNQYERIVINNLNNDLLSSHSKYSLDIILRSPISVTAAQRQRMREFIEDCNNRYSDWGFKDPRTCLTYPVWAQVLPFHRIVVVFRSYTEVLSHYTSSWWRQVDLVRTWKALRAWTHHNDHIIKIIQNTPNPYVVLSYEALMTNTDEFDRLSKFVGHPLTDVRDKRQYRSRSSDPYKLPFIGQVMASFLPADPSLLLSELHQLRAPDFG